MLLFLALTSLTAAAEFENITPQSGITFQHNSSKTSRKYLIESVSGGVAMFDYDNDGRLDLFFVNGAKLLDPMKAGAVPDKSQPQFWNRLYRNLGNGKFQDVTEKAGVKGYGYGMGVAAADFDNDGHCDLYVTNFGANILYRNRGDGTFEDVTAKAGVRGGGWSSSAAWVDFDNDGRLDLAVARYVQWDFEPDLVCGAQRSYCHPDKFQPIPHLLFRNKGDGTFEDVSARSGFDKPGKGLGITIGDYDRDGKIDIAIANDSFPQQLFRNLANGRFEDVALNAGVAYDDDGRLFAGMGIDFGDYDNDGWPDLFINALAMQGYALFHNRKGSFDYVSRPSGVNAISRLRSGWGARFVDLDNDGWKDLFVAQSHVMDNIAVTQPSLHYRETPLLMRNENGKFVDVSAASGPPFQQPIAARGAAFGDLDNDGWIDIAINCNDGPPVLLRNRGGTAHWLALKLRGTRSNRDGIGAKIRLVTPDGREQHAIVSTTGSYASSHDPRIHFGLGRATGGSLVEITWPSGVVQKLQNVTVDQLLSVTE